MSTPSVLNLLYLLDTNVLIHAARGGLVWERLKAACDPLMAEPRPRVCIVTGGEVRSFAQQNDWGDLKRNQVLFLLGYFTRVNIDTPAILEAYAQIDTYSRRLGFRIG